MFKAKFLKKKNHCRKVGNGSFDSCQEAFSYETIKNFPRFVSDYLKEFSFKMRKFGKGPGS